MSALYTEVAKLQVPMLDRIVADTIIATDKFLGQLEIVPNDSIQFEYNQYSTYNGNSGATSSFAAPDGIVTPSSASYTNTIQKLSFALESFNIPDSFQTPQFAAEWGAKSKVIARTLGKAVFNAKSTDTNVNFSGLRQVVSGSVTDTGCTANGSGSMDLQYLDTAIHNIKVGTPNCIVTSLQGLTYLKRAIRTAAATPAMELMQDNYGNKILSYWGIPIYPSEWIGNGLSGVEENTGTSIYVMYNSPLDGVFAWTQWANFILTKGPIPVPYSVANNYTIACGLGLVAASPYAISRVYGITG